MSAVGHFQTHAPQQRELFDHLISTSEYRRRNCEAQCLRGLEIDHELVLGRRLHWQVGGLLALENTIDVARRPPILIDEIRTVGD